MAEIQGKNRWMLIHDEYKKTRTVVRGQFAPENLTENIMSDWKPVLALNQEHPLLQFAGGALSTITFGARVWAENKDQDVTEDLFYLRYLVRRNEDFGRPPICLFTAGSQIRAQRVVVRSIGGVRYLDLRPDGKIRGISFRITLLRYVEFQEKLKESTPLPKREDADDIKKRTVKQGETLESIAAKEYNDAYQGVNVRKANKLTRYVNPGDLVKIYPPDSSFMRLTLTPDSVVLSVFHRLAEARNQFFDLRSAAYFSPFIKW